jgi:hypothetical protein
MQYMHNIQNMQNITWSPVTFVFLKHMHIRAFSFIPCVFIPASQLAARGYATSY